ncbi:MAG: hypothetical protein AAB474_00695 [Patescibacteria group bacterium]
MIWRKKFDRSGLNILPLKLRQNKMTAADVKPLDFVSGFQDPELDNLAAKVAAAAKNGREVIAMMGSHAMRRGCARFFIDLMERRCITHLASNASLAIHDFEMAYLGATLEDVEVYIYDGKFGNWEEGRAINEAVKRGVKDNIGFGRSIGRMIENEEFGKMPYKDMSLFAAAFRLGIPATVHKGIGLDITDQHPSADYAALGKASGDDFLLFAESISKFEGGVFLNFGSQIFGPEVYLKALSMARNVAKQENREIRNFTTGVFDVMDLGNWREKGIVDYRRSETLSDPRYYFRPLKSILIRTIKDGGESYYIKGDFGETIPAFYSKVVKAL